MYVSDFAGKPAELRVSNIAGSNIPNRRINFSFDTEHDARFAESKKTPAEDTAVLLDYVETEGFKISANPLNDGSNWVATVSDVDKRSDTYKVSLSAFAPTMWEAYQVLKYKFVDVLGANFETAENFLTETRRTYG